MWFLSWPPEGHQKWFAVFIKPEFSNLAWLTYYISVGRYPITRNSKLIKNQVKLHHISNLPISGYSNAARAFLGEFPHDLACPYSSYSPSFSSIPTAHALTLLGEFFRTLSPHSLICIWLYSSFSNPIRKGLEYHPKHTTSKRSGPDQVILEKYKQQKRPRHYVPLPQIK